MAIRLICSDIDGTLLQYGKKELEGEIFEQIRELHRRGILFCPASGRQYTSLRKLFAPVADCCVFLCENGGVIYKDEQCIAKNPMLRALAEEIANDLWTRSDGQGHIGSIPLLPTRASACAASARRWGIELAEVMAFGDNYNDVPMLDIVGTPYIMDGAAAPLREKYQNHTPRPEDVLREFLKRD